MGTIFKYPDGIYEDMDKDHIKEELKAIRKDLKYIKKNMVEVDSLLSDADKISISAYEQEKIEGKLVSHRALKKELGL